MPDQTCQLCKAAEWWQLALIARSRAGTELQTAALNGIEPEAYLREVIAHVGADPVNRPHQLPHRHIASQTTRSAAA